MVNQSGSSSQSTIGETSLPLTQVGSYQLPTHIDNHDTEIPANTQQPLAIDVDDSGEKNETNSKKRKHASPAWNQWSKLPMDMLLMVAGKLDTSIDTLRLRSVCSSWRLSLPRRTWKSNSPFFSVTLPFPIAPNPALDPRRVGHFTLSERTIFHLQPCKLENTSSRSSKGWMVSVEESKLGKMRVLDPLSMFKFVNLPKISSKVLNLLNCRVSEIYRVPTLQFVGNDRNLGINELQSMNIKKVVTSSIKENAVDFAVFVIHSGGELGYFKFGDEKWSLINYVLESSHYEDIIYFNGNFFAINHIGVLLVIDSSVNVKAFVSPVFGMHIDYYKFLVESLGNLYLVDKYLLNGYDDLLESDSHEDDPFCSIRFTVFKMVCKFKDDGKQWVEVKSLGDRAFFIGNDCCFSVSASQLSGCKSNCIYFTEIDFTNDDVPYCDIGMFDLKSGRVGKLSSFEGYSEFFWPPPTWIFPKESSKPSPKTYSKPSTSGR